MKKYILFIILLFSSILLFAQEKNKVDLLKTDSTWGKEIFHFPIHFAKEIDYKGVEDARFPKAWGKRDSSMFWSYVFAWSIDLKGELTERELENHLETYFDGLMKSRIKREGLVVQNTNALFLKKEELGNTSSYVGKVRIFEAFYTKQLMTLYVLVDKHYCAERQKSMLIFRFSPREFGDDVWLKLKEVKLRTPVCDL